MAKPTLVNTPVDESLMEVESLAFQKLAASIATTRDLIDEQKAIANRNKEIEQQMFIQFGARNAYAEFCLPEGMNIEQALKSNFSEIEEAVQAFRKKS